MLKADPAAKLALRTWVGALRDAQARAKHLSVLGHTAILYLVKSKVFADEPAIEQTLVSAMRQSWVHFTGLPPAEEHLLDRLPWHVLRKATQKQRAFHRAAFRQDGHESWGGLRGLGKDYVPEIKDAAMLAAGIGLALLDPSTTLGFLGGLLLGAVAGSTAESFQHKAAGHASQSYVERMRTWAALPPPDLTGRILGDCLVRLSPTAIKSAVGRFFYDTYWGHGILHHAITFEKNHVTQFRSAEEKAEIDAILATMGTAGQKHIDRQYGLRTEKGARGFFWFIAAGAPLHLTMMWLANFDPAFCAGVVVAAWLPPCASRYVHPWLHSSIEDTNQKAGPLLRWLLNETRFGHNAKERHYHHHLGLSGGNYSLLEIGDRLLDEENKPTLKELIGMHDIGLI